MGDPAWVPGRRALVLRGHPHSRIAHVRGRAQHPGRQLLEAGAPVGGGAGGAGVIPAYPGFSVLAAAVVVVLELRWLRTGVFRLPAYWISMGIIFAFQIPVDGWMTKLSDPIVIYNPEVLSGWRFPLD